MTTLSIPAYRWDAANDVPLPESVLFLDCTEGHGVPITHRNWHLVEEFRCELCGCLADVFHARRYVRCPCSAMSSELGHEQRRAATDSRPDVVLGGLTGAGRR